MFSTKEQEPPLCPSPNLLFFHSRWQKTVLAPSSVLHEVHEEIRGLEWITAFNLGLCDNWWNNLLKNVNLQDIYYKQNMGNIRNLLSDVQIVDICYRTISTIKMSKELNSCTFWAGSRPTWVNKYIQICLVWLDDKQWIWPNWTRGKPRAAKNRYYFIQSVDLSSGGPQTCRKIRFEWE